MTANATPPWNPKSNMERMLGWERAATAWASRSSRASARSSLAKASGTTLIATSRRSFES